MTIGVILTVFNLELYVEEAIQSVLQQSRKPDQLVVVNDGSADNSSKIISRYQHEITLINNEKNKGVLPSTIEALELIGTDIVTFLDGDDRWPVHKLREIEIAFNSDPGIMMVTHGHQWINGTGVKENIQDVTHRNLSRIVHESGGDLQEQDHLLKKSILTYRGVWLGSALCIKKEYLNIPDFKNWSEKIWGHALAHQDQPLAAFMIADNPGKKIHYIDNVYFDYRVYGNNSSGTSASLDKALMTLSRSRATLMRTKDQVSRMADRSEELRIQERKLQEVDYWESLYQRQYKVSTRLFAVLFFQKWSWRERMKEIIRFAGVFFLGPKKFLRLK